MVEAMNLCDRSQAYGGNCVRASVAFIAFFALLVETGRSQGIPPRNGFVTVAPGIRLHYLDFGGHGETVLLLPGLYATAEVYSEFAPRLTDTFHVLALTRRGHGQSDEPATGYEPDSLVEDIRVFLDSMRIERVHLVGHSLAGVELTALAGRYPERVLRLVYLDAAYDRQLGGRLPRSPVRMPEATPQDFASPDAYVAFMRRHPYWLPVWSPPVESTLRASLAPAPQGGLRAKPSADVLGKIVRGAVAAPPAYDRVRAPVLSLYALADTIPLMPGNTPPAVRDSAVTRQKTAIIPYERASIEELRRARPDARIVELSHTHHYVFLQRRDDVARLVREFLLER